MAEHTCSIAGCPNPVHGRGWCRRHYMLWWRHGDPEWVLVPRRGRPNLNRRQPIAGRFWSKVDFSNPDGCWLWIGSKGKAARGFIYGEAWRDGKRMGAHRAAYELVYGTLAPGLHVCHHCDTPLCVRPDHLFAGTQADNMSDCSQKSRWRNQFGKGAA